MSIFGCHLMLGTSEGAKKGENKSSATLGNMGPGIQARNKLELLRVDNLQTVQELKNLIYKFLHKLVFLMETGVRREKVQRIHAKV